MPAIHGCVTAASAPESETTSFARSPRHRQRLSAAAPVTHTMRARIVAIVTAAATHA